MPLLSKGQPMLEEAPMVEQPKKRGRPPKVKRRRKQVREMGALTIPAEIQAKATRDGVELRWFNDIRGRVHNKTTNDDWDVVDGMDQINGGKHTREGEFKMVLCQKPKEFCEEDRAKKEQERRDKMANRFKGETWQDAKAGGRSEFVDKSSTISRG